MKKLFSLVAVLCCLLSVCCTSRPPAPARAPDPIEVSVWRDFELVLHGDTDFADEGRRRIERAASSIRRLTHDRARISVEFDLDFQSLENLKAHHDAHHSQIIGVTSDFDIVKTIDAIVPGPGTVLAATAPTNDGSFVVVLILDRIEEDRFEAVVTHEFGHVIGLPDLKQLGAIMSGSEVHGAPYPTDWTRADVELCRSFRYCD